jgi:hypothetical protein
MTQPILHGHEFYVRIPDDRAALEAVLIAAGGDGQLYQEPGNPYCLVLWAPRDFVPPEHILRAVSRELEADVIWLAWQKQVDAFAFQRWAKGVPMRRLAYGVLEKERTWELVDGTAEPWEPAALFPPKRLELQLRVRRSHPDPGDISDDELRRIWREQILAVDSEHPQLVAVDVAHVVARHYQLPGWRL